MCWPSAPASRGWGRGSAPRLGTCQAVPPSPRSPAAPPVTTAPLSALPAPRTGQWGFCTALASLTVGIQDGGVPIAPGLPYSSSSACPMQAHCETPLGKWGSAVPILMWILSPQHSSLRQTDSSHHLHLPHLQPSLMLQPPKVCHQESPFPWSLTRGPHSQGTSPQLLCSRGAGQGEA